MASNDDSDESLCGQAALRISGRSDARVVRVTPPPERAGLDDRLPLPILSSIHFGITARVRQAIAAQRRANPFFRRELALHKTLYISFWGASKFSHKTGNELRTLFGGHRNAMAARLVACLSVQSHTQPERQLAYARILYPQWPRPRRSWKRCSMIWTRR